LGVLLICHKFRKVELDVRCVLIVWNLLHHTSQLLKLLLVDDNHVFFVGGVFGNLETIDLPLALAHGI
jgi:hypothetical protein